MRYLLSILKQNTTTGQVLEYSNLNTHVKYFGFNPNLMVYDKSISSVDRKSSSARLSLSCIFLIFLKLHPNLHNISTCCTLTSLRCPNTVGVTFYYGFQFACEISQCSREKISKLRQHFKMIRSYFQIKFVTALTKIFPSLHILTIHFSFQLIYTP